MTRRLAVLTGVLLGIACASSAAWATDSCVECHRQLDDSPTSATGLMSHDIHLQRGLSCADCHGGDPAAIEQAAAMDPAKGFIGLPARQDIPGLCARCHADPAYMRRYNPNLPTDQYAKYLTSQHGKRFATGDTDVAVCTSCHQAHGVRSKKDPASPVYVANIPGTCASCHTDASIMERHGLPVTQHWEYSQSVHGQALLVRGDRAAPHCASCHGSHEAARPGVIAVGNVCAQCHGLVRDLFAASPHKAAHEALGLPECEVCHGNHLIRAPSDDMLGTGSDALCITCHEPGSIGFLTAQQMREQLERLKTGLGQAKASATLAAQLGMDVGDEEFELHAALNQLTQARAYVHSFSAAALEPIVDEGLQQARRSDEGSRKAIHEFHFRRHGLWLTLVIIICLVGGLWLVIRELERPDRHSP